MCVAVGATSGMGRGGTGLSSCASAWSGAAVTSKKDRDLIAPCSLPSIVLFPQVRRRVAHFMRLNHGRAWALDGPNCELVNRRRNRGRLKGVFVSSGRRKRHEQAHFGG